MIRFVLLAILLVGFVACEENVEPIKVDGHAKKPFEQNPTDTVGVAEGDKQVSPFGKPAH